MLALALFSSQGLWTEEDEALFHLHTVTVYTVFLYPLFH